jgi:ParB family transcriptional regulator, chromosome partitioning protein
MAQAPKRYITGKLYDLDISTLFPDPSQPRKFFDEQALLGLTSSIEKYGVLQPVLVRRGDDGKFLLVSGERRYQAALAAGHTTIPALVTKDDPVEISIVENLLREDLTAIEEAEAVDRLKTSHQYQLTDLAKILGKAESTISEILSLNRLPAAVKDECRNDPKAARGILTSIAKQKTEERMQLLYNRYKERGLTRGEIRERKTTIKAVAAEAAQEAAAIAAAAKTAAAAMAAPVDLSFVGKCTKRLDSVEISKLDRPQSETFIMELDLLRLSVIRKLRMLKATLGT